MKCYYHEKSSAVATCQCGKGLCKECASKRENCICDECVEKQELERKIQYNLNKEQALIDTKEEFITAIIKGILCLIVGIIILNGFMGEKFELGELLIFFIPFGWAVFTYLESFLPTMWINWILYIIIFLFKLIFSAFLGIFCFIYQVIKFIIKLSIIKRQ